jgi:hypothetical protein
VNQNFRFLAAAGNLLEQVLIEINGLYQTSTSRTNWRGKQSPEQRAESRANSRQRWSKKS